ncbi:hypothetical protein TWF730_002060 [Orbilia blumenaviensis]|uniref:Uncharacterized protein n=1 Tax=Orbilia blumenaviensis TaxID=1796055 RepID=A0AAV9UGB3_9PEZI
MEPSQDSELPSSSSPSPPPHSSPSSPPNDDQPTAGPSTSQVPVGPKGRYDSKKRVESYSSQNKPAYQAVKEAAAESLLINLNIVEKPDDVWLRDTPKPTSRVSKREDPRRPYYWAVVGNMSPTEEKGWMGTIERAREGSSCQTGSRWGTENLRILEGMLKSGRVRPFFGRTGNTPPPAVCGLVAEGGSILGLGWGLMGDDEDPSSYDKEKYAEKGITLLRDLPDPADLVLSLSKGPEDEDPKGKGKGKGKEVQKPREE